MRYKSEQVHDMFKNELYGSLMSHHRFADDQVRAWLTAIANKSSTCLRDTNPRP